MSYFGVWDTVAGKQFTWKQDSWTRYIGRLNLGYKGPLGYAVIRIIKLNSVKLSLDLH